MGIKVKYTTKRDDFPSMKKRLEVINGTGVEVGVLQGKNAWLASIHEFGCDIPVTDGTVTGEGNMRGFLQTQGLFLKKTTTHIHIPERSFLRTGYDKNRDKMLKKAQKLLVEVAAGRMSSSALYKGVGGELSSKIKDYARDLDSPANHPFTIERKGSSNPLKDSGDMIEGITWRKK